jgi:flagellar motor switch protein FliN
MSPENENPAGSGDISEDELRKILGDDYDSVVGKDEDVAAAAPAPEPVAPPAPAPAPPMAAATGTPGDGVTPNMTDEEAEAWAAQLEVQMAAEAAVAPPAPVAAPMAAAAGPALATASRPAAAAVPPPSVQPVQFAQIEDSGMRAHGSIDMLLDVRLPISVELGRTEMEVKEILECGPGTVIELTKLAGEPVDIYINGRLVAQGEVVVVDEHFGVRVTSLLTPAERVRSLA